VRQIAGGILCGNGIQEEGEFCDDGNRTDLDACANDCRRGLGSSCIEGRECGSDLCSSERCRGRSNTQECDRDTQCLSGLCRNGICEACRFSRDCSEGSVCQDGRCTIGFGRPSPTEIAGVQFAEVSPPIPLTADLEALRRQLAPNAFLPGATSGALSGGQTPDTGPAAVALMAAGAAAGLGWVRRRRK
jgi:cysteine-rich repeat protein